MGGLVVKKVTSIILRGLTCVQAIIDAYNDRSYFRVLQNIKAIVFLGTPHRGADRAGLLSRLLSVSFAKSKFVDQLRVNSELIEGMNDQFRDRAAPLELVSFFESKEILGVGVYFQNTLL